MPQHKGAIPWNKGKKGHLPIESIMKMRGRKNPSLGQKRSEETKKKMSLSSLGKPKSLEHRLKLSISKKEKYKNGLVSPFKKIWKDNPEYLRGKNNNNWKGGIAKIDKKVRLMSEYKIWRSEVFQRDGWTCQTCHQKSYVTAHHIKSFSSILKEYKISNQEEARKCSELWDIDNGVTLCEECHSLTDNYKGRNINK